MKIKLIVIGKTDESFIEEGIEKYLKRLKHYINYEVIVIPDIKQGAKLNIDKLKEEEGKLILQKIETSDQLILLDEKGKNFTSEEFSVFLQKKMNSGFPVLIFVVGGAFGFSPEVYQRANETLPF